MSTRPTLPICRHIVLIGLSASLLSCADVKLSQVPAVNDADLKTAMVGSFQKRGQAGLDRLDQDNIQKLCSVPTDQLPATEVLRIAEQEQLALVKYPADGKLMGDWKAGERVAQSGRGLQFSDPAGTESGGNCYACHQISPQEISYGTIGPSLLGYGKTRGASDVIQRYTFAKIWNPQSYSACSNMPRFGHSKILTEQQIKDVVALLLDPNSPVNK